MFPNWPRDQHEREQDVQDTIRRNVAGWERQLARTWPEKPGDEPEPEVARSVSEQVRATRSDLRDRFEMFMRDASAEEIRLLRDVLMATEGARGPEASVPLAASFSAEIARHTEYIRVSDEHDKLVREYLELLEKCAEKR